MTEKCYSENEEDYKICDVDEIVQDVFEVDMCLPGGIRSFFEADAIKPKASSAMRDVADMLIDNSHDEYGELSDGWLDNTDKDDREDLQVKINSVIDEWADKNKCHPTFYEAKNVKQIAVRMLSSDGKWEYV